jgi:hypothetical protein
MALDTCFLYKEKSIVESVDSLSFSECCRVFIFDFTEWSACYEPGSSVGILSGYGLDDRAIEVRSPAEAK